MSRPDLTTLLGITHPVVLAPMAGGPSTPALAAAVSNAGGLGQLGCAYLTPAQITAEITETRRLTDRPFGVNLFTGGSERATYPAPDPAAALALLGRHYAALGLPPPAAPAWPEDSLAAQIEAVLAARVAVFSFTFGIAPHADVARFRAGGTRVVGTATTVEEARMLADAGVDAVAAQGAEAGGHRGTFAGPFETALVGTLALVPQIVDALPGVPVLASGGIMDGRGIIAARALGAAGAQMGTAFLTCSESGLAPAAKARLLAAREDETLITRAFSGRPARALRNLFTEELESAGPGARLPFPLQNAATRPMRNEAGKHGDTGRMSIYTGQGLRLTRALPAGELVARLVAEMAAAKTAL